MRYYYDTEFLEDGQTIDLISIGIVADDGREFYAVNLDADWSRIHAHTWLETNVVPHLPRHDDPAWMTREQIRAGVHLFLTGDVELWADYCAYDHVALAQLFGPMVALPPRIPMYTNDIRTLQRITGVPDKDLPIQYGAHHDALADARHVRNLYNFLSEP